jgi:hypothetical protein
LGFIPSGSRKDTVMSSPKKIRALHVFFVQKWLADWIAYYKEAKGNAEANCKYMRNIKKKTALTLLELEVSEHCVYCYGLVCDFIGSRAQLMQDDLNTVPVARTEVLEQAFLIAQLTQLCFAVVKFTDQKALEVQHSIQSGLDASDQFEDMPEIQIVFRHQIAVANACADVFTGFNQNISKLIGDVLKLLK